MSDPSAADLLARWRQGDQAAAAQLYDLYAERLIGLARQRLPAHLTQRFDPEDVVQSAYRSFFVRAREGGFAVHPGGDLWRLLVGIMLHKLQHQIRRNSAAKRAVKKEQTFGSEDSLQGLQDYLAKVEPSPAETAGLVDEMERFMSQLDPTHRQIVELRLQGLDHEDIAAASQRSEYTVRRVLKQVKEMLESSQKDGES